MHRKKVSTDILEVIGNQALEEGGRGTDQTGMGREISGLESKKSASV